MEKIPLDIYEQILVRLDAGDLIRCKSVCWSWHSVISDNRFIKAHLNNSCNNAGNHSETGHRRVVVTAQRLVPAGRMFSVLDGKRLDRDDDRFHVVGSCNGLVCIISAFNNGILVANPTTREVRKLRNPQIQVLESIRLTGLPDLGHDDNDKYRLCWGFGYDSSIDDYKVVLGFNISGYPTGFLVLTLKSNVWKFIGEVKYVIPRVYRVGTLCNGALHWIALDPEDKVYLSFDLSREEFKEIPGPEPDRTDKLGIFKGRLCALPYDYSVDDHYLWVLKNDNVQQSWERVSYVFRMESSVFCNHKHMPETLFNSVAPKNRIGHVHIWFCEEEDNGAPVFVHSFASMLGSFHVCISTDVEDMSAPVFVQSLVSPHGDRRRRPKRKRQALNIKGSCKLIKGEYSVGHLRRQLINGDHAVPGSSARV